MDIVNYLKSLGFKPVTQTDTFGKFIDYEYLNLKRTYAELHDDGMFYLWFDVTTPLISVNTNETPEETLKEMINKIIFNELCS